MGETLRYAIIGCGRIAPNHLGAAAHCPTLTLCALCDLEMERCEALLSAFPLPKVPFYADYREMLRRERPNLVAIATDSGSHGEIGLACLRAGANVLIEKPLALSLQEADALMAAAEEENLVLAVCHQNRFNKAVQRLHRSLEAGAFGQLYHLNANIRWNRGADYYRQAPWRGRWASDGGTLMNQCIHNIDLLRWISGQQPVEVFAYTDRLAHPNIEAEDFGAALVRFSGGVYGIIEGSTNIFPKNLEETLYVFGSSGTAKLGGKSVNRLERFLVAGQEGEEEALCKAFSEEPESVYGFGHRPLYEDVVAAIRQGGRPLCDGRAGREALELVLAIYASAASGKPVSLPLAAGASGDYAGRFDGGEK